MSAYRDFITDFPDRCLDLLKSFEFEARMRDREVTLLLMTAATAFVITLERLGVLGKKHSTGDNEKFKEVASRLKNMASVLLSKSIFAPEHPENWLYGKPDQFNGGPDSWNDFKSFADEDHCVSCILSTIRNALAHGNLYTEGNPIRSLVFWSERYEDELMVGYKFIKVPVEDFRSFLVSWVEFLRNNAKPIQI